MSYDIELYRKGLRNKQRAYYIQCMQNVRSSFWRKPLEKME